MGDDSRVYYEVRDHDGRYLMTAPLDTIRRVFKLKTDAEQRIPREATYEGGICYLHFNGRCPVSGVEAIAVNFGCAEVRHTKPITHAWAAPSG